jgi:hypothetical protein
VAVAIDWYCASVHFFLSHPAAVQITVPLYSHTSHLISLCYWSQNCRCCGQATQWEYFVLMGGVEISFHQHIRLTRTCTLFYVQCWSEAYLNISRNTCPYTLNMWQQRLTNCLSSRWLLTGGFLITNNNLCVVVVVCDISFPLDFAACCLQLLQLCPSALFICWQDAVLLVIKKLPAITTAFRTTTVFVLTMRRVTTFNCRKILLKCDIV